MQQELGYIPYRGSMTGLPLQYNISELSLRKYEGYDWILNFLSESREKRGDFFFVFPVLVSEPFRQFLVLEGNDHSMDKYEIKCDD